MSAVLSQLGGLVGCLLIFVIPLLAACGGGGGSGSGGGGVPMPLPPAPAPEVAAPSAPPAPARCTVDLYGDSIMRGEYRDLTKPTETLRHAEPPAATLARLLPHLDIADHTRSGIPLAQLMRGYRFESGEAADPFAQRPRSGRVVVLESGVIDAWGRSDTFESDLIHAVGTIRAEGRVAVLTGFAKQAVMTGLGTYITTEEMALRDHYNETARRIAKETGALFADMGAAEFRGPVDIIDDVHPTKSYSDRLMERLAPAIAQACAVEVPAK